MVIDPEQLNMELEQLDKQGIPWKNRLFISDRAHLVVPSYKKEDIKIENKRIDKISTTKRGIGVAYAKKMLRTGIRVADLHDASLLHNLKKSDRKFLEQHRDFIETLSVNCYTVLNANLDSNKILFEGAQGVMLDIDLGTYPYVTSGLVGLNGVASTGFPTKKISRIIGVAKAYSTRVGEGPFPTEFPKEQGGLLDLIRQRGNEKGSTTGRLRRCGYLDLISLKYACDISGINSLVLTHLDVLDVLESFQVCVGYEHEDNFFDSPPSNTKTLMQLKPVLKTIEGWQTDISTVKSWSHIPANTRKCIDFIESFVGVPIEALSVGPDRSQMVYIPSFKL
ncbi:adenylosuccinate synthetase-like [Ylistrum balloti]|uniref:adenylosuccinate synthetase-like n=1 Tax=Ylistrum balloti TaxID=509963 RepID=UPI002905CFFF|nr:adenylosuccinate synthetase-like [Ylistrum balloti]